MTLQVNPQALDGYAGMLGSYGDDAMEINQYVLDQLDPGAFATGLQEGLFTYVVNVDKKNKAEVHKRLFAMADAGSNSQTGLGDAADAYTLTDGMSAAMLAKLDSGYPDVDSAPMPDRNAADYTAPDDYALADLSTIAGQFTEVDWPHAYLVTPNGDHLEPKMDEITAWTNRIGNWVSVTNWLRVLQEEIVGYDPIEMAIEFFTGDWKVWAKLCDGWQHCGRATEAMSNNLIWGWNEILANHYWTGNAADEAAAYFRGMVTATDQETTYYGYLHTLYYAYMRVVYDMYNLASNVVNALIDLILTAAIADIVEIPEVIVTIVELAGKLGDIVGYGPYSFLGMDEEAAILAGVHLPPKPDCLIARHPYSDGYEHPSKTM